MLFVALAILLPPVIASVLAIVAGHPAEPAAGEAVSDPCPACNDPRADTSFGAKCDKCGAAAPVINAAVLTERQRRRDVTTARAIRRFLAGGALAFGSHAPAMLIGALALVQGEAVKSDDGLSAAATLVIVAIGFLMISSVIAGASVTMMARLKSPRLAMLLGAMLTLGPLVYELIACTLVPWRSMLLFSGIGSTADTGEPMAMIWLPVSSVAVCSAAMVLIALVRIGVSRRARNSAAPA